MHGEEETLHGDSGYLGSDKKENANSIHGYVKQQQWWIYSGLRQQGDKLTERDFKMKKIKSVKYVCLELMLLSSIFIFTIHSYA